MISMTVKQLDKVAMFIKDQKEKNVSKNNIDSKVVSHLAKKNKVANQAAMTVERERKEVLQLEADIERLKVESAKLTERNQEQQRQVQRQSVYQDYMEEMCKMTTSIMCSHSLTIWTVFSI